MDNWKEQISKALAEAKRKGLYVERSKMIGWFIFFPDGTRKKVNGVSSLVRIVEDYDASNPVA